MYLEAIQRATRNIWMTHAYFIPDQDFVDALKAAAGRGVDVRLLLPLKSNHIVADWISRGYFSQLLLPACGSSGSRTRWCTRRPRRSTATGRRSVRRTSTASSLQGNYEINVEVIDESMAEVLEEIFRRRRDQLPRAHPRRVGGARPAPQVHRVRARSAAAAALTPGQRLPGVRPAGGCAATSAVRVAADRPGDGE